MSLADWVGVNNLQPHVAQPREIRNLLQVIDRDLAEAKVRGSDDWRFHIAFNAALQAARLALLASGYELQKGDAHHFKAIASLQFTIGADSDTVDLLQKYRAKRRGGVYDAVGTISPTDASDMIAFATALAERVQNHLKAHAAHLLK